MVEFAIILIVLMLVVFAGIEFDRMVMVYSALSHAARAGVRYAIVHGSMRTGSGEDGSSGSGCSAGTCCSVSEVETVVMHTASASAINAGALTHASARYSPGICVDYRDGSNVHPSRVRITVVYTYDPFTVLPLSVNLNAEAEGRIAF